jgi:hypothetical protein
LQRRGIEESSFLNLQRGAGVGQLSVSHDSVFPGEVPQTRPLSSSVDAHGSLEVSITNRRKDTRVIEGGCEA